MECCSFKFETFADYKHHVFRCHFQMKNRNLNWKCTICDARIEFIHHIDNHFRDFHPTEFYLNSFRPPPASVNKVQSIDSNLFESDFQNFDEISQHELSSETLMEVETANLANSSIVILDNYTEKDQLDLDFVILMQNFKNNNESVSIKAQNDITSGVLEFLFRIFSGSSLTSYVFDSLIKLAKSTFLRSKILLEKFGMKDALKSVSVDQKIFYYLDLRKQLEMFFSNEESVKELLKYKISKLKKILNSFLSIISFLNVFDSFPRLFIC